MHQQSWVAAIAFAVIGFIGGYFASWHGPSAGMGATQAVPPLDTAAQCFFSPDGGCTRAVTSEMAGARHSIHLQGFTFTSPQIATALMEAHRRGIDVQVLLDAGAAADYRTQVQQLHQAGIPIYVDAKHAAAHSKVVLIDTQTLITGSFDFTPAAETDNAENLLILHDQPRLQAAYEDNFRSHLTHSEPLDLR
jgi:phosphatidylserine/phosphatidylglycerophosphate/cardiolipin synthase-like enzyme